MAKSKTKATPAKSKKRWQPNDNQRWVVCFTLLFLSLFVLVSIISYYFTWRTDQMGSVVANNGGSIGYKIANLLVGDWFGVCALGVPIVVIILSVRIMLGKATFMERSVRITTLIMILGAVTLGAVFATNGSVFGSGLGGKMGIDVAAWLQSYIGKMGLALLLFLSWVLLAVYINSSSTIRAVNSVTRRAVSLLAHKHKEDKEDEEESGNEEYFGADRSEEVENNGNAPTEGEPTGQEPQEEHNEVEFEIVGGDDDFVTPATHEESNREIEEVYVEEPFHTTNEDDDFEVIEKYPSGQDQMPTRMPQTPTRPNSTTEDDDFVVIESNAVGMDGLPANSQQSTTVAPTGLAADAVILTGGVVEATEDGDIKIIRTEHKEEQAGKIGTLYDPTKELSRYQRPPVEILEKHGEEGVQFSGEEINDNKDMIQKTLESFGITIKKITATIGPTVTLYEIEPAMGMKVSRIKNLEDDIAISLKALSIRLIVPMPGRGTIGIEIPNRTRRTVSMHSVVRSAKFQESKYELPVVLGKTIQNETFVIDLAKMPHLLVAGATGQGKSVGLNVIINSLLYKKHPAELKFVMVDPKKVELSLYAKLEKHYLAKMESEEDAILTDTQKVVYTLNSLCNEMQARYDLLQKAEVRKISEYNQKFLARKLNPNKGHRYLPYIVVVIDEFADMIMTAGKEVETPIVRLGQLARAIGIHMIIATQRPDAKVITGLISANCPARIAFKVTNRINSQIILGGTGAEKLIGNGDMLIQINGVETRLQCAFLDTPEIERITSFVAKQQGFSSAYLLPDYVPEGVEDGGNGKEDMGDLDDMFEEIARFVVGNQQGSTSFIQRRFKIGYNRAGRIMDQLEQAGIVGRSEGSKPREVLISDTASLERILNDIYIDNL
ncbi:MAG: DNA translocase FtsK 4TM domain-containing protein [Tidjanibacter sp.]|nr:DNA translocase FtsK 4TM domain-containing protein [Tidjanibacter sp.]